MITKLCIALTTTLVFSTTANATLLSRMDGQAYYDTVLDITWLTDANYAMTSGYDLDGLMDWDTSVAWVEQLDVLGHESWRLPAFRNSDDNTMTQCTGKNCSDTEMSFMYYENLNGDGSSRTSRFGNADPFINVGPQFWTGIIIDANNSGNYHMNDGLQFLHPNTFEFAAWAVMDGDIAAVPVPASLWLFLSGITCLIGLTKRKT